MRAADSKEKYQGVFIAAPTPMKSDGAIDLPRLKELIAHYKAAGLRNGNAVCTILGAGGEAMQLTNDERKQVAQTAVEAAAGELPIFIGVGHTETRQAVELAEHADKAGADGLQVEPPYYFANTADDAFAFIKAIAEAVECGLGVYNTPWTSALDMDAGFIDRICAFENVVGIKWYSGNFNTWARVIRKFRERLSIVSNFGALYAPLAFLLGARGYVSQDVSAVPRPHVKIAAHLQKGEYQEALELLEIVQEGYYNDVLSVVSQAGYGGEPNFIKAAMDAAGLPCGPARLPTRPLPPELCEKMKAWYERVKDLG